MLLNYSGVAVSPEEVARLTFIPDVKGSLQAELLGGTRSFGRIPYVIAPDPQAIIAELKSGHPVLVLQNYGLTSLPYFHYAVVIGITPDKMVVLRSGDNSRLVMSTASFLMSWQRSGSWGMIVLKPGELPGEGESRNYISAVDAYWQTEKELMQLTHMNLHYTAGLMTDWYFSLSQHITCKPGTVMLRRKATGSFWPWMRLMSQLRIIWQIY